MTTIALHGDFANPTILKQDIGPKIHVDIYFDGLNPIKLIKLIQTISHPVHLIAYSKGGYVIAQATQIIHNLIKTATLYETPVLDTTHIPGNYPILIIWNTNGRRRTKEAKKSNELWTKNHPAQHLTGKGFHTKIKLNSWPIIRHGWDQKLNPQIQNFININN